MRLYPKTLRLLNEVRAVHIKASSSLTGEEWLHERVAYDEVMSWVKYSTKKSISATREARLRKLCDEYLQRYQEDASDEER